MWARLIAPVLRGCLLVLDWLFDRTRPKIDPPYPYDRNTKTIVLPAAIEAELRQLVAAGNTVAAVKRVTRLTGAGLRVSKAYVDHLAGGRPRRR